MSGNCQHHRGHHVTTDQTDCRPMVVWSVENTCANIALLEFMFHGIKTCRLPNTPKFMTSQCALNHRHCLVNSELGNMNGEKKQHSTSSQWIRKGENDGCSIPWRFKGWPMSRLKG